MKSAGNTYFHGMGRSARRIMTTTFLRRFLKSGLYLAAILLLPGALIVAPLLWWLGHRRKTQPQPTWKACS